MLLHLQLPLLHFLKHLLRGLNPGSLIWLGWLLSFRGILIGVVFSGSIVDGVRILSIRVRHPLRRRHLGPILTRNGCLILRLGRTGNIWTARFGHENHASQAARIRRRSKKNVVEARSVQ